MNAAFQYSFDICMQAVKNEVPLLYYSHIPTATVALFVGFFVFFKDKKSLISRILLAIAISFSFWVAIDLIVWLRFYLDNMVMFAWSLFSFFYLSIFIASLYFVYVYFNQRDVSIVYKILFGIILLPTLALAPTKLSLTGYDGVNCQVFENQYFTNYYYVTSLAIFIWIIVFAFFKIRKNTTHQKKQYILLTIGIELFLFSFLCASFFVSYLIDRGIFVNYDYEQFGLFGMPIFLTFLGYLIVKYRAFHIKLLATQALVAAMIILIASQFAFIQNNTNKILTGITLALSAIGGWMLIQSVKLEVQRKEELQEMSNKLASANDQLRKLDNAKSEFISIASHQLRTPLTAVKGYASLLLEGSYGAVSPEQKETLNKIYQSNERLVNLVEDLLNLSRIESGRMEYNFEKVKMEEICQDIFDTFIIRAKERKLYLDYKKPESPLPEVMTDRNKIREVVSNLVDNALKYTQRGGVTVRIKESEGFVQVAVTDTGIGVPKEEMPYLFSKFSRGKDVKRLNATGTGLGLHVGKSMIEAMKGRLFVESEGEGKGSTFYVEVPVEIGGE